MTESQKLLISSWAQLNSGLGVMGAVPPPWGEAPDPLYLTNNYNHLLTRTILPALYYPLFLLLLHTAFSSAPV